MISSGISFTISGLPRLRRSAVSKALESLLPGQYPDQTFAFLGNPFAEAKMCPFILNRKERSLNTYTRQLRTWALLNEFAVKKLVPSLKNGQIAMTDGFGLDSLLFSVGTLEEESDIEVATHIHHDLVKLRLKRQHIKPPHYFILRTGIDDVVLRMKENDKRLRTIPVAELRQVVERQDEAISAYFKPETGQTCDFIDATMSVHEMAETIAKLIGNRLSDRVVTFRHAHG